MLPYHDDEKPNASGDRLFAGRFRASRRRSQHCSIEMHLSHACQYAIRLSLNQAAGSSTIRKSVQERCTMTSAVFLATIGLSLSMFSVRQMQACTQARRRHH
ncbi:hypothetical protein KPH14_005499 [Odynerus spinipes]|uniref:Uncharacterized protein n=1 Tax=Odynerus spinipes TaxID=1348599 RepID=A0AAD9VKB1_9HYME|nr:hypothetical protein KPH14_005499 [Odynerus spinipes]